MTTSQPSNASEWQLYNVLKRANLLQYYDTFIAQGGDDVQQLCEAGEDEFLEIMALVGMAAKPLHVRRLQKALQEWVANPTTLEANVPSGYPLAPISGPAPGSITAVVRDSVNLQVHSTQTTSTVVSATTWTPHNLVRSVSPVESVPSPSSASLGADSKDDRGGGSPMLQPVLLDSQIRAIAIAASRLAKEMPLYPPKDLSSKKQINREIQNLITTSDDSPNRIEELRKYAAIYGRFDSKRKNDRPMSLHEISVNEAAAQLCLHCPALLTRREDLFPLARQVVRESGYQYSKGHSRATDVIISAKKARLDSGLSKQPDSAYKNVKQELDKDQREELMSAMAQELLAIRQHQEQVRAELATAKEEQDFIQTQKLQSELASLTNQQLLILQEHNDLLRKPRSRHHRAGGAGKWNGTESGAGGPTTASGSSSPNSDSSNGFSALSASTLDSFYAAVRNSNGTLFEEGLRIAQQYGMADFAQELKDLQSQKTTNDGSDDGSNSRSVLKEFQQPFELKEVKPEPDSGLGDDSFDGHDNMPSGNGDLAEGSHKLKKDSIFSLPSLADSCAATTPDLVTLQPVCISPPRTLQDANELKRKGDNLEVQSTRPPSRRSRSSQNNTM